MALSRQTMDLWRPASACGCAAWRLSGVQVLQGEGGDAVGAGKMPVVPVGERSRGTRDPTGRLAGTPRQRLSRSADGPASRPYQWRRKTGQ